ncbi:MAG: flagellar export protein FliJ [Pedosphaera sp.]|nr:flagellar export protein FliJ [Pedosphaera sp.]MSU43197.1 flagellar export protein FliJ [Pedosphaera sp.]
MKPYRFTLQSVLGLRENEEVQAQESYAQALRVMEEHTARRRAVEMAIEANHEQCRRACAGRTSSEDLMRFQNTRQALREQLKMLEPYTAKLQAWVDERHAHLVAARQRRESLDKLEEKQRLAHNHHEARQEQLSVDEMAGQRSAAKSAGKLL